MIRSIITDNQNKKSVKVSEDNFLQVVTKDYYKWDNYVTPFVNDIFGNNLAINASPSGAPEEVHNGTDSSLWTASSITGTWTFNSTNQAHTGTKSINGTATVNNDVAQIAKGSNLDLTDYTSLSGWIYITAWSLVGVKEINIQGWDVGVGAVGTIVDIGDYVVKNDLNTWQKFTIPLSDMSLTTSTIDAIRISISSTGGGTPSDFYLDDIRFQSAGTGPGTQIYTVNSIAGKVLRINKIAWNFVANYDSSLANSSMPNLSYDDLLGNSLDGGLVYNRRQNGEVKSAIIVRTLLDLTERPNTNIVNVFYDGTNTYLKAEWEFAEPQELYYPPRDQLRITISDDLSIGFNVINVRIIGGLRDID